MLIVDADIQGRARNADVRIAGGRIVAIGSLQAQPRERVLQARGGALLPGLHDHHLHLLSLAASLESIRCGPPQVNTGDELAAALKTMPFRDERAWIRGIGYHESVAGEIDRHWLDRHGPDRPVRVQHRSGRLWILNSAGLDCLAAAARTRGDSASLPDDGRLYDADGRMRDLLGAIMPPVGQASRLLAGFGITGLTDMTPANDPETWSLFARLQAQNQLLQRVRLAGSDRLDGADSNDNLTLGETKIHLHESALPPFDAVCATIRASHRKGRGVAVHCVTEAELVYALAALREASPGIAARPADRIEHASITPPALLHQLRELKLTVVTQPNFVRERGDAYLDDIAPLEHPWLYRCRGLIAADIKLGGGSDAPFGDADPWRAMRAAVTRTTHAGRALGPEEAITPEQALGLFLGPLEAPAASRTVAVGASADLCLLDRPWSEARHRLEAGDVRAALRGGGLIFDRVDQTPAQSHFG